MLNQVSVTIAIPWTIAGFLGFLVFLLIYFILNPEKAEKWKSIFAKLFSFTRNRKIEKIHISKDIQSKLNIYRKKINKECKDLIPFKTDIRFLNPLSFDKESIEHHENKVILILKNSKNQDENFVRATKFSVENTLIPNSRRYINPLLLKSLDMQFIKNLISKVDKSKLNFYLDNYFFLELENNTHLEDIINTLDILTEGGAFTRILLNELKQYGSQLFPRKSTDEYYEEVDGFFKMIKEFAYKKSGEDINPNYNGKFINASIVMIGKSFKLYTKNGDVNTTPYMNWIFNCEDKGIKSIYLLGRDSTIIAVQMISSLLDLMSERFQMISKSVYRIKTGNKNVYKSLLRKEKKSKAICIHYLINNNL